MERSATHKNKEEGGEGRGGEGIGTVLCQELCYFLCSVFST